MIRELAALIAAASIAWPTPPAPPATKPVTNEYFGHAIVDRYQYFENLRDPVVQQYFKAQSEYTNAVLGLLEPGLSQLKAGITRLVDAGILRQVKIGRRNRAFEAPDIIDAFADLERQLASPAADTRTSEPARRVPRRRQ